MPLQAATVGILIEKSKFDPVIALGVAEAIEVAMTQAQFVTVPILDARFQASDAKIEARFQAYEAKFEARFQVLEGKLESGTQAIRAELHARLAEMEAKVVKWVFLVMVGNVALSLAANIGINAFEAL